MATNTTQEWQCKTCHAIFDTKGKKDAHHKKKHQNTSRILSNRRTNDGNFICHCGKGFLRADTLKKHQLQCNILERISSESEGIEL